MARSAAKSHSANFSLSIHENQIIGIVGESGCGKSTLLKLLMRFWAVNKGRIGIVDIPKDSDAAAYRDIDLSEINTANLRDMESYMTQDTQMFKDTIAGNIRIAKLDATKEEVEAACRKASLHDWIMTLPDGHSCTTRPSCCWMNRPATSTASMRQSSSRRFAMRRRARQCCLSLTGSLR